MEQVWTACTALISFTRKMTGVKPDNRQICSPCRVKWAIIMSVLQLQLHFHAWTSRAFNLVMTLKWRYGFKETGGAAGLSACVALGALAQAALTLKLFDWHMLSVNEGSLLRKTSGRPHLLSVKRTPGLVQSVRRGFRVACENVFAFSGRPTRRGPPSIRLGREAD